MIELKDISKIYKLDGVEVVAVKNISVKIEEGEFVSIMGPSGSGKSTLLHIIGCLDVPTSGLYRFFQKDINKLNEFQLAKIRNKYIGFVFQNYNLLARTSAIKNIELPMVYAGVGRETRQKKAEELLDLVGLIDRMHHRPSQLSGGQQQKVAIARALANNPKILLADEPTGNLDSKSGEEIMQILRSLNKKGITVIMVTHNRDIAGYSKRIIELKDGEIIKDEHF